MQNESYSETIKRPKRLVLDVVIDDEQNRSISFMNSELHSDLLINGGKNASVKR